MDDQQEVVHGLSNGTIFNDLERPFTWFSRSRHFFGTDYLTNGYRYGHSYIDALDVLYAQLTSDLFPIAKLLYVLT